MIFEYEKPLVEILRFMAQEFLANERDAKNARDGGNGDITVTPGVSTGEDVEGGW